MSPARLHIALRHTVLIASALALSACQMLSPTPPPQVVPPEPALRLLELTPLTMPKECQAVGSFIVEFTVEKDGRTGNIQPPVAPPCVQSALSAWVASFRYAPPSQPTPASVEWLLVDARRGS